jgi:aryl-alcohol dehydrogenase-like predicted oxidoreductase/histidinol phosphatase-like enzyme
MRLSTAPDRDPVRAEAVITAAVAAGVELFDTADAYCHDDTEIGANESLLAPIAHTHRVVTKGGLVRPGGAWVPNGRGRHLAAAARASRDRLGVATIDLYLLHAIDPKVPLATSVGALTRLRDDGVIANIGLSNVTRTQLEQARALTEITTVQVELHPWNLDAIRGGLVSYCEANGIAVLVYRPLGGVAGAKRAAKHAVLRAIAKRHDATPHEIVLAWIRSLSPAITVLPGATRLETLASCVRGQRLILDDDARQTLAAEFLAIGRSKPVAVASAGTEVVMILGMPAAGKSTLAEDYVARGYARLNRDDRGGSLLSLARVLDEQLAARPGTPVVVDNTYPTRASRAPITEVAARHGVPVKCLVVATTIEQAQAHASWRLLERCGSFDAAEAAKEIRPGVQFRWRRDFEPPSLDEGFAEIEEVAPPRHARGERIGLVVELDGVVWKGKPLIPSKIELRPGVVEALAPWAAHPLGATVWRPGATREQITALATQLAELLGRSIDVRACLHGAGPQVCWCRKPLPGLAIALARDHDLDLAHSTHLGRGPADRGFAQRAGMVYAAIDDGWPVP